MLYNHKRITLPETNSSPLKNGCLEYDPFLLGFGLFSGDMLVSGRVTRLPFLGTNITKSHPKATLEDDVYFSSDGICSFPGG